MNEFDLICTSLVAGILGASVVVLPVLACRWVVGNPLFPEPKPIDVGSRKGRNMLMFNVVGTFGTSAFFFGGLFPICGGGFFLLGVFSIVMFEHYDRKLKLTSGESQTAG